MRGQGFGSAKNTGLGATLALVAEDASTHRYDCTAYGFPACKAGHCAR